MSVYTSVYISIGLIILGLILNYFWQTRSQKVGNYIVYSNQRKIGDKFFEALLGKRNPVLTSENPQMGKTGTIIWVIFRIIEHHIKNNNYNFEINYILQSSDKSVKDQNEKDINDAFREKYDHAILNKINIAHRDNLDTDQRSKIVLNSNITYYNLYDECHEAINKKGSVAAHYDLYKNQNTHNGFSSATPYAHSILSILKSLNSNIEEYEHFMLENKKNIFGVYNFYGISQYHNDGRIKKSDNIFIENMLSKFGTEIIDDFIDKDKKHGHGYFLCRSSSKGQGKIDDEKQALIKEYIKNTHDMCCDIRSFDSGSKQKNTKNNLNELESFLKTKPNTPTIILICNALRLAKRVPKNHIRCVFDTPNTKTHSTVIQSLLGRMCGYNMKNKSFNIYCNNDVLKIVKEYIKNIKEDGYSDVIPSTNYSNSTAYYEADGEFDLVFVETRRDAIEEFNKHKD